MANPLQMIRNAPQFIQQVRAEAAKVTWPTRQETITTTIMVFIMVTLTAICKNFPGYVLVKMDMTDAAYHLVKDTKSVVGFLGDSGKPQPVPQREIDRIMDTAEDSAERPRPTITFEIGEKVKVIDGPFESFLGEVQDVDHENARLKVSVSIFGRETPVELEYAQVSKQG